MTPTTTHSFDLFISYVAADREWVEGYLFDALDAASVRYFSDEAFQLGAPRLTEFERGVKESQRTLLVLSPAYLNDGVAHFVDLLAQSYGLDSGQWSVIPLILQPVTLPPRLALLTLLDATDPARREEALGRLFATLKTSLPGTVAKPPCPYPGMAPFREEECDYFFGRSAEIEQLVQRLRHHPFVAIIGPSGSGKSSLVFAGLIPALRRSTLFGVGHWAVRVMRPGEEPQAALHQALGVTVVEKVNVATLLAAEPDARRLLLVVDQFEEVFTLGSAQCAAFLEDLRRLMTVAGCFVVITVRADFYPDLMSSSLWSEVEPHQVGVRSLDEDGLREAIVRPAEQVGVYIESALVERLLANAAGEPGVLPFVQEVLVLLWEKIERRYMPLHAYEALVLPYAEARTGLQVAMAQKADAIFARLTTQQQRSCHRIFLRMVQFGEGRKDTRRQQPVSALRVVGEDDAYLNELLGHLAQQRLLTLSSTKNISKENGAEGRTENNTAISAEQREPKIDLAHEALIEGWPLLHKWVRDLRDAELTRRRLEAKVVEWVRMGRGSGGLLDATELAEAQTWFSSETASLLGSTTDLLFLVEKSRKMLNPGWHRWGVYGLVSGVVGTAALLGLLYLFTSTLPTVLQVTLWLSLAVLVGIMGSLFQLQKGVNPFLGQQLSHWIAHQRVAQVVVGVLSMTAIALWAGTGVQYTRTIQYCRAQPRNYQFATGTISQIALLNQGVDPYYATVVRDTIATYGQVKGWLVTAADAETCALFFNQIVNLKQHTLTTGEISYVAQITGQEDKPALEVFEQSCESFGKLAFLLINAMVDETLLQIDEPAQLLPTERCEAWKAQSEGFQAYQQGNYADAKEQLQRATALEPTFATAYHTLGLVYLETGEYAEAVTALKQAVTHLPTYALFLKNLAAAYYLAENYALAEASYRQAISADPTYIEAYSGLAYLYITRLDNYAEAEQLLQEGLKLLTVGDFASDEQRNFYESVLYKNIGILAFMHGQWTEATAALERADELHDNFDREIVHYLASTYQNLEKPLEACQYWARLKAIYQQGQQTPPRWLNDQLLPCDSQ